MLANFTRLRALVLIDHAMNELPNSIGNLKHLRYLNISKTNVKTLPVSINKLYNLQTLRVKYLTGVPVKFGNLINLRHFIFEYGGRSGDCTIDGIGQMTCLQTLPFFAVSRDKGCQIEDLGSVNNLKGELKVFGLEDVRTTEAAKKANLLKKSRISALQFHWSGGEEKNTNEVVPEEKNTHEHVLEGLTPHSNLKRLRVQNFRGKNFSSWMMMPSQSSVVLQNLVDIKLIYCQSSEQIPTLGHLPCLKFIYIGGLHNLKRIGAEFYGHIAEVATGSGSGISAGGAMFPALRNLRLANLRGLEEWLEVVRPSPFVKVFPCLEELELLCLSKLSMVPSHFPAIKNLRIVGIDDAAMLQKMSSKLTTLTSLDMLSVKGSELQLLVEELLGKNVSLKKLTICNCEFSYLPIQNLVALERFSVVNCLNLTSISDEIGGVTSLKEFKLRDCGKLTCLPKGLESLVSLEDIKIENLEELTWFPGGLQRLSSLVHLAVVDCPKLKAFPGIHGLTSLKTLLISGCKTLTSLPSGLQDCTFLQILHIIECPALVSTMDLRCLTSLRRLGIGGYSEELNYFPWPYPSTSRGASMLECVSSLESLYLTGWPMLKSLPVQLEQLYALKELYLWHFDGLEALPEWLSNLSSLRINSSDSDCDRKKTVKHQKRLHILDLLWVLMMGCYEDFELLKLGGAFPCGVTVARSSPRNGIAMAWKFYERSTSSFVPQASDVAIRPDKEPIA
ncbi:hypothetical protein RJ640_006956 [Escallonia rubra]|uniref:R13L1/DRL21-like LRR repeat region domain-containing protein n=1 Tax=Escallonia rubra TaxID=112253 RepID=A0AA88S3C7_9ASTE|nr:hypothetical protein RJ640_006956 [Escallonia rubra]